MADVDVAVGSLLETLKRLLVYHAHLIRDARDQLAQLENDLRSFKAFLEDSTEKWQNHDELRELVLQIRDVVYEAEDIIEAFVTQAAEMKSRNYFVRAFKSPSVELLSITEKVKALVRHVHNQKSKFGLAIPSVGNESEAPIVRQDKVVGFEDEEKLLISCLTQERPRQLDVITIVGMSGLGKTTLAGKIFRNPVIKYEFPIRIWVYVSQEFIKKDVFLDILKQLTTLGEDIYGKSDQELAQLVASHLEREKFLIVMDDVRTAEDWDKLQLALPKSNKRGKVLITSCKEDVGWHANRDRVPHKLRFLTLEESWMLLQLEVFDKLDGCPPELQVLGRLIAEQCRGLPLAIVVVGGRLAKHHFSSADTSAMKTAWRKECESVHIYLNDRSYNDLPYQLRPCFLYFGMFPKDYEIPVSKLICMWIAEGFIQPKEGISLEETAENYLEDLIDRSLVMIDKIKLDGKAKTCRIHHTLRDFCKLETSNERENFLQEIEYSDGGFQPPVSDVPMHRRLCIHSNVLDFLSSKPSGTRARSFVSFSKDEIDLPTEYISAIPAAFQLLRVLDIKPFKFTKLPSDFYQLVHLRYLALIFDLRVLPAAFSKFWNIQTLIVDTTSHSLEIKADIWNMTQLRHLKTNASATFPKSSKHSKECENLQTLGTISPECCTKEFFERARTLKKLGIRGRLSSLLVGKAGSFDSLGKLSNLEKLKLLNVVSPNPPSEGQLCGLPPAYKFPPKLRSLTLADTFLDWRQMSILGLLENLEVLKLKDKAFMGAKWVAADGGFRNLEVLHIGRTDLVVWEASAHHFPRLRRVELRSCERLVEVPIGLAEIPSLQLLDLYRTKSAAASAKRVQEAKQKMQEKEQTTGVFKLSIVPPDE